MKPLKDGLTLLLFGASVSLHATEIANSNITEAEIKAAQDGWGFKKGDDGKVRIMLHHSSLPYGH